MPVPEVECTGGYFYIPSTIMVLADLGRKLNAALSSLNRAPVVDEKVCRSASDQEMRNY